MTYTLSTRYPVEESEEESLEESVEESAVESVVSVPQTSEAPVDEASSVGWIAAVAALVVVVVAVVIALAWKKKN